MNETNQIKYGRIEYFEPNEHIEQEDLTKYVNLYVSVPSRYYNNNKREYDSILGGNKIEDKNHKVYRLLTDSYSNITYNSFKNGEGVENCELFGIENIEISFDSQFFPTVTVRFNDVKGHGLMSTMEHNLAMAHYGDEKLMVTSQSFFKSLFNFPYPRFTLEVKGYLGSTRKYNLNLLDFNTEFDSLTGDFKTTVKFIGDMYGLLADIPMSYLLIAPFLGDKKNETNIYWNKNDNIPTFIDFLNKYALISAGMFESENNDIGTVTELIEVKNKLIYLNELKKKLNDLKESAKITEEKAIKNENCVINEYDENNDIVFYVDETSLTEYGDMNRKKDEIKAPYKNIDSKYIKNFTDDIDLVSGTTNNECWGEIKYQVLIFKNVKSAISKIGTEINDLEEIFDEEYFSSEFNEIIYDTIGFKPTIKNLYLMVIKHLECFMAYYYDNIKNTENYPIISGNQSFVLDINDGSKLAPFTSFYSKIEGKYIYPLETNLLGDIKNLIEDKIVSDIIDSSNLTYNKIEELISQIETFNEENRENDQGLFNGYFFGDYMYGKDDEYYAYGKVFRTMNLSSDERIELIYKIFLHRAKALKSFYPKADLTTFIDNEITNLFNTNYFSDDFVREILNFNLPDKFYDDIISDVIDINYGDDSHLFCRFNEGGFTCNIDGVLLEDKSAVNNSFIYTDSTDADDYKESDCFILKEDSGCTHAEPKPITNSVYDFNFLKAAKMNKTPYAYGCFREIPFTIDTLSYLTSYFKVYGQKNAQSDCCEVKKIHEKQIYLEGPSGLTFSGKHILAIAEYIMINKEFGNALLPAYERYEINNIGYLSMGFFSNIKFTNQMEFFALIFFALYNRFVENGSILIDNISKTIKENYQEWSDYSGSNTDLLKDYLKKNFNYYGKFSENEKINLFFNYKQVEVAKNDLKEIVGSFKNKIEGTTNIKRTKTMELNQNEQAIKNNAKILKNSLYYNIKNLHDKWLCSLNADYFKLQNNIKCLTPTFNNNDNCICDITLFYKLITNILDNNNLSVIEFLSKIGEDNGLLFLIQPYMGEENISKMFKPQKYLPTDESLPTLIYISQCNPSHNVNIDNNEMPDDGFSLTDFTNNGLSTDAMIEFIENEHDYKVEAFGVTYGMQNQNIFTNININTLNPITTEHSIANIISISNQVGDSKKTFTALNSTNLYSVYSNRSYSCSVTMMGCVDIRPLMYFQLNNIPLFRGAFLIYDVKHTITPNDFTTTFTGVRVSKYKIPIETKIVHLNRFFNNWNKNKNTNNNNVNNNDNNNDNTDSSESMEVIYKIDENVVFKSLTKDESEWVPFTDSECNVQGCWRSAVRSARKLLKRKTTCVNGVETDDIGSSRNVVQLLYEKHDHGKYYNDNEDYALYYEETDNNRVDKYKYCVEYMKNEIGDKKSPAPIIVGVAHSVKRWDSKNNKWLNEGITDHFICVYAYAEKNDKVFFKYFESGRNTKDNCVNDKNILIYDPNNGNPLFYNNDSTRNKYDKKNRRYDVSQIRIYGKHMDRLDEKIKVGPQKSYNEFHGENKAVIRDKSNVYNIQ